MSVEAVRLIVAGFLGASLLFYGLFAGADFGAGVLELLAPRRGEAAYRATIQRAIGPVWEANHVWLILAIVILFNGFPPAYAALTTVLHIPLTAALIGIIVRGCAFTFRHYDVREDGTHRVYAAAFAFSSVLTPLTLGIVAGAAILGSARPIPRAPTFAQAYVYPWLNGFCFATGLFAVLIFAFLAAVYLVGETADTGLRAAFVRRARALNAAVVLAGGLLFAAAELDGLPLLRRFAEQPAGPLCWAAATLLLWPLWRALRAHRVGRSRVLAAAQMSFVLLGGMALQFPLLTDFGPFAGAGGGPLTVDNAAASPAAMNALLAALAVGSALIFPSLYWLLRIFKFSPPEPGAAPSQN